MNHVKKKTTRYKIAAILMIIHGGLFELGGCLAMIPLAAIKSTEEDVQKYFSFIVPYFNENLVLMSAMSGIYGIIRLIGAIGLLKNRMWGLILSIINCIVTMTLMMFMLPAGVMDGIFACTALVLILMQYYGGKRISERM